MKMKGEHSFRSCLAFNLVLQAAHCPRTATAARARLIAFSLFYALSLPLVSLSLSFSLYLFLSLVRSHFSFPATHAPITPHTHTEFQLPGVLQPHLPHVLHAPPSATHRNHSSMHFKHGDGHVHGPGERSHRFKSRSHRSKSRSRLKTGDKRSRSQSHGSLRGGDADQASLIALTVDIVKI